MILLVKFWSIYRKHWAVTHFFNWFYSVMIPWNLHTKEYRFVSKQVLWRNYERKISLSTCMGAWISLTLETHHHVWGLKDRQNVLSTVLFIIMRKLELKSRVKLTLNWSNQWLYILQHEINENSCTTTIQVDLSLFCMETTCLVSKHGSAFRVLMISWPMQSSYSH